MRQNVRHSPGENQDVIQRTQTIQGGVKEVIYAQTEQPFQNRWLPKTPTITQF